MSGKCNFLKIIIFSPFHSMYLNWRCAVGTLILSVQCYVLCLPAVTNTSFRSTIHVFMNSQWFCVQMKLVPSNNSSFCPFLLVWMVPLNSFTFIIFHSSWILPSQLFSFIVMAVRNFIITLINRNRVTLGLLMITFGHQNQNTHFLKLFRLGDFMLFILNFSIDINV